jgi:predicted O-methyltransferase YrrM
MSQERWSAVDAYIEDRLIAPDPGMAAVQAASDAAGLPPHAVTPAQGKLLYLLAKMQAAQNILEIGTLGGYSATWLARAVAPAGRVVSLEANRVHAAIAKTNLERAGFGGIVDVRLGRAVETLELLFDEGAGPFDFIFIDADKPSNPEYLRWSLKLSRPGTVIVGDNVVRDGAVADPSSTAVDVRGVRAFFDLMAENPRLSATAIQTVGSKGYDGFSLAIVQD